MCLFNKKKEKKRNLQQIKSNGTVGCSEDAAIEEAFVPMTEVLATHIIN
jgi:hypothetical protein